MEADGVWRTKSLPGPSENVLYQLSASVDLGQTLQIYTDLSSLENEVHEISNRISQLEATFLLPPLSMITLQGRCLLFKSNLALFHPR